MNTAAGTPFNQNFSRSAGPFGWYATTMEMFDFLKGAVGNRFLSYETTRFMFENSLGWDTTSILGKKVFRHDGFWAVPGNLGMRSSINIYPDNYLLIFFSNTNFPGNLNNLIYDAMIGAMKRKLLK